MMVMRRALCHAATFLCALPLWLAAQDSRCAVEGMVMNSATGDALARAAVTLRRSEVTRGMKEPSTYTASSNSAGKYEFTGVEPGTYVLTADRNGFAVARYSTLVKLGPGQKSSGLLLMMTPHAVITGRVVDEEGEPVVGADVQVSSLFYAQGRKQLSRSGGGSTNDLGEYRIYGLAAGKYFVSATYRANPVIAPTEEYATTFYPRTTDAAAAVPLQVPAGAQMRGVDVTLARTRTVSVRGKVACDIEGEKRTIFVNLTPRLVLGITNLGMGSRGATVGPDGAFEVPRVAPGSYTLLAIVTVDAKRYSARTPVQVGATNIEGLQLTVRAGAAVNGVVRIEGRDYKHLAGLTVGLSSWESGGIMFGPAPVAQPEADGTFQMVDVNADRYSFRVTGLPDGYYVKSVRSGGVDVLSLGLEVASGVAPLEVLISPNAGGVEGTVVDPRSQKPAAGVKVALVPNSRGQMDLYRSATADSEGRFRFRDLIPGDYKLFAWETVENYAWMDPDFIRGVEGQGEPVSIAEGSTQPAQVKLIVDR
jgi:hypothetical protein